MGVEQFNDVLSRFQSVYDEHAVLAGGCIRDTILGKEVKDLDFVTEAEIENPKQFSHYEKQMQVDPWRDIFRKAGEAPIMREVNVAIMKPDEKLVQVFQGYDTNFDFCYKFDDQNNVTEGDNPYEDDDDDTGYTALREVIRNAANTVNIIICEANRQQNYLAQFPDSISMVYYDGKQVYYHPLFLEAVDNKKVYLTTRCKPARELKLRTKYPEMEFIKTDWEFI